jgi:hypothetical protein
VPPTYSEIAMGGVMRYRWMRCEKGKRGWCSSCELYTICLDLQLGLVLLGGVLFLVSLLGNP